MAKKIIQENNWPEDTNFDGNSLGFSQIIPKKEELKKEEEKKK